ncbi:hypothetical protein CSC2_35140 [Clostridium zeae]|uniref:Sigma factor regulator C-terminal domain-containing protein n=1 Tax=Clostridium zeae TaxID=2759022 RepID=A0ABQ1EEN3_9CLOT|nr:anti sigma factor C-terminal domain-containing protein [Clostridium zeae]GFZ32988.1 hypothetical protein CSC2_35140 [Clostridium zeae]
MKSDDEKLKELFGEKEKPVFSKVIKKAKLFSVLRTIILSLMIVIILSFVVLISNAKILNNMGGQKQMDLSTWYNISMPNAYIGNIQFDDRIFTGEIDFVRYRFLGNKPITDGSYKEGYGFPLFNGVYGDLGFTLFGGSNINEITSYNKAGKRIMKFYHPSVKYDNYINNLDVIDKIGANKLAEMSLSFDKAYTIDEVREMLPKEITLNWYWVDTYNEKDLSMAGMSDKNEKSNKDSVVFEENYVYGIKALDLLGNKIDNPEEMFIGAITMGSKDKMVASIYKNIFNKLSQGKGEVKKDDLKIIGVVVSGDTDSLNKLKNQNYIKAATLGAVADKY